jgi:hypothetical protein
MLHLARSCGRPPLTRLFIISGCIHVSQDQPARFEAAPLVRVDELYAKLFNGVRDLSHTLRQCRSNQLTAFATVHRGQWLDPVLGSWNDSFAAPTQRARKQPVEPFRRKVRQVAGNDQIPARLRSGQCSGDPCQGSAARSVWPALGLCLVRYRAQAELGVSTGRSNNCDFGDERPEQPGGVNDQRVATEIEKSFVAAHARAGAPRKNEASDLAMTIHYSQAILRPCVGLAQRSGGL